MPAAPNAPSATSFSALMHSQHSAAPGRPRWLYLGMGVALLAIAVQLVAMAQLAQWQVQRGVQLRQTLFGQHGQSTTAVRSDKLPSTASAGREQTVDDSPSYVLR